MIRQHGERDLPIKVTTTHLQALYTIQALHEQDPGLFTLNRCLIALPEIAIIVVKIMFWHESSNYMPEQQNSKDLKLSLSNSLRHSLAIQSNHSSLHALLH